MVEAYVGDGFNLACSPIVLGLEKTLNYWMIVTRCSTPNGVVCGSTSGCGLFSLLDMKKLASGHTPSLLPKRKRKKKSLIVLILLLLQLMKFRAFLHM